MIEFGIVTGDTPLGTKNLLKETELAPNILKKILCDG